MTVRSNDRSNKHLWALISFKMLLKFLKTFLFNYPQPQMSTNVLSSPVKSFKNKKWSTLVASTLQTSANMDIVFAYVKNPDKYRVRPE